MADFTNIDGKFAKDTELRSGIDTLRTTVLSSTIKPLTVTDDGTYTAIPSSGIYGYSPVIVNTSSRQLPDAYEQLDYIICPSLYNQAGFTISNIVIPNYSIFDATSALEINSGENAFFGFSGSGSYELYYQNMKAYTYGTLTSINSVNGISIQLNTPYRFISILNNSDSYGISVGYYRVGSYTFKGKIYRIKVYNFRNTKVGDAETIQFDFYPARRKSDNKIGMYERVNDVFYSSTTGTEFEAPSVE